MYSARAILPILLIIALGHCFARFGSWERAFYLELNRLCFRFFLPVQLFCNIYNAENFSILNWRLMGYILLGIVVCLGVGVACAFVFPMKKDQRGVVAQAAFRSNHTVLGLPLVNALGGEAAMPFASLATATCVPVFNVLAVICLTCFTPRKSEGNVWKGILRGIVCNPLIWGCLLGVACCCIRQLLPQVDGQPAFLIRRDMTVVYDVLTMLSKVASPVMLFVLGTTLDFSAIHDFFPQLTLGIVLRLVAAPVLMIGTAVLLRTPLHLTKLEIPTMLAIFASPVAVSSAIMVQQIGGDVQLANQLIIWTSVLSMLTIFVIVFILRAMGLL